MVNINTGNIQNKQNVLWSRQLADKLDAADGQKDGKIDASIWNSYLTSMGSNGNKISNYITVDNASRSFDYYAAKKDAGNNSWKQWNETFDKYSGQEMLDKSQDTLKNLKNAKKEDVEVSDITEQQKKYDSKAVTAKCYEFNDSKVVVSRDANGEINRIQVVNADTPDEYSDVSFRENAVSFRENAVSIDSDGDFSDERQINKKQQNDLKSMLPDWIVNDTETSTPSSPKNVSGDEKQLSSQSSNATSASLEAEQPATDNQSQQVQILGSKRTMTVEERDKEVKALLGGLDLPEGIDVLIVNIRGDNCPVFKEKGQILSLDDVKRRAQTQKSIKDWQKQRDQAINDLYGSNGSQQVKAAYDAYEARKDYKKAKSEAKELKKTDKGRAKEMKQEAKAKYKESLQDAYDKFNAAGGSPLFRKEAFYKEVGHMEAKIEKRREKLNKPVINSSSQTEVKNDSVGNQVQQASHSSVQSKPQNITSNEQVQAPKVTSQQNSEVENEDVNTAENKTKGSELYDSEKFYDLYSVEANKKFLGEYSSYILPSDSNDVDDNGVNKHGYLKRHVAGAMNAIVFLKPSHSMVLDDGGIRIEKNNDNSITIKYNYDDDNTTLTFNQDGSYRSGNLSPDEDSNTFANFVDEYLAGELLSGKIYYE